MRISPINYPVMHFCGNKADTDNAYKYFNSLKTDSGELIFARKDEKDIKYALSVNPSSTEASYLAMLIELIKNGTLNRSIMLGSTIEGGKIIPEVKEDIEKLFICQTKGKEPIDVFVPIYKNKKEAKKNAAIGDVFGINNKNNAYILNSKGKIQKLDITRETYFELFPPVERYGTRQGANGNCWEIAAVNSALAANKAREKILKLFHQQKDDISVSFPYDRRNGTNFEKGELPPYTDKIKYSKGANGVKLFEYAEGRDIQHYRIQELINAMKKALQNEKNPQKKARLQHSINFLSKSDRKDNNIYVECNPDDLTYQITQNANALVRRGGNAGCSFVDIGFSEFIPDMPYETLYDPSAYDKYLIDITTKKDFEKEPPDDNITPSHSYRVIKGKVKNGKVETIRLANPHGILEKEYNLDEIKDFISIPEFFKI